jgi:hypothetical protein
MNVKLTKGFVYTLFKCEKNTAAAFSIYMQFLFSKQLVFYIFFCSCQKKNKYVVVADLNVF